MLDVQGPLPDTMEDYDYSKRARNFVLSDDNGRIFVYGPYPFLHKEKEVDVMNAHHGFLTCFKQSYDNKIIVSTGKDGTVFVYKVQEVQMTKLGKWSAKLKEIQEQHERDQKD